jgi:hypothetical protein
MKIGRYLNENPLLPKKPSIAYMKPVVTYMKICWCLNENLPLPIHIIICRCFYDHLPLLIQNSHCLYENAI